MKTNRFDFVKTKIHNLDSLQHKLAQWRLLGKKLVFTNGCFDLLHYGHVDYLSRASSLGDIMVVGVNSDASTSRLKGKGRPVNDENSRTHILASLSYVHAVVVFDEPTPIDLIKIVRPDFLVKGGDYKPEDVVGYAEVTATGGSVICLDFVPGYSTTALERKILESGGFKNQ